jgi:hypothetical protein
MIRIVLAGADRQTRALVAGLLAERLGDADVSPEPPTDPRAFDAELARIGEEVDALLHLGGAPDALLDHYGRAVVEATGADLDGILCRLREAFAPAAR